MKIPLTLEPLFDLWLCGFISGAGFSVVSMYIGYLLKHRKTIEEVREIITSSLANAVDHTLRNDFPIAAIAIADARFAVYKRRFGEDGEVVIELMKKAATAVAAGDRPGAAGYLTDAVHIIANVKY